VRGPSRVAVLVFLGFAFLLALVASNALTIRHASHLVVHVIDGDTIVLESGDVVRYLGIDAPELDHSGTGPECFGQEAADRNRELVERKRVHLQSDVTDRDAYGRLLRYVFAQDTFVNAQLVREGYAFSSYYPPDVRHYEALLALELAAQEAGAGLWAACED
jgi:micrococcal nuclease